MARIEKKLQKNIKKNQEKNKKEYPLKNQILYFTKIIYVILLFAILAYGITVISNGTYKIEKAEKDYSYILAGQTFNKLDKEYYVLFYSKEANSELEEETSKVTDYPIYKVNLDLANNKNIISSNSNKEAQTSLDLKISETTLIKIENGKNTNYIEGYDQVVSFLKTLQKEKDINNNS